MFRNRESRLQYSRSVNVCQCVALYKHYLVVPVSGILHGTMFDGIRICNISVAALMPLLSPRPSAV